MKEVRLPSTVKTICKGAFEDSGLRSVTVPISVDSIRTMAFCCAHLRSANVYPQTKIDRGAFNRDTKVAVLSDPPEGSEAEGGGKGMLDRLRKLF